MRDGVSKPSRMQTSCYCVLTYYALIKSEREQRARMNEPTMTGESSTELLPMASNVQRGVRSATFEMPADLIKKPGR